MKRTTLFTITLVLLLLTPVLGQIKDATEQSKRLARTQYHITKSFKGEVVKLLYLGSNSYGGVLNGFIFRRPNGKLLKVAVPTFVGQDVGPHLITKGQVEITITGDKLLLEEIFYKTLPLKKIEVELEEQISGLANIQQIKTEKGAFSILDIEDKRRRYKTIREPVLNVKVISRIRLKNREGILALENGDSLIFERTGELADIWNQNYVSYLRQVKNNPSIFYQNPKTYSMGPGHFYLPLRAQYSQGKNFTHANLFLQTKDIQLVDLINDAAGFVNGISATDYQNKLDTFVFNRTDGKAFNQILQENEKVSVYFQKFSGVNVLRAVSASNKIVKGQPISPFSGEKEEYLTEKVTFKGNVSEIQYLDDENILWSGEKLITPFRNIILEDSIFIRVNEDVALSIAKQIKKGKEISFDGWQRKELKSQINQKGYTYIIPHKITIDGITFTNRSMFSNSL